MVDEVKTVEADIKQAEVNIKTAVTTEVASVKSKIKAFVSKYSIPSASTVAGYVGGHFKVLTTVVAVVKHFL